MATITPHQKQYVLGPRSVAVHPDWVSHRLSDAMVLSHCPRLRSVKLLTKDNVPFYLLGLAVLADPMETRSITVVFGHKTSAEIETWTSCWAGRWLLISEHACYQDAGGLLGLCYRRAGGNLWISSSPAILGEHLPDTPVASRLPWRIAHERGMDWIPAPFTTREGVLKVMPLRALRLPDGTIAPVRYEAPPVGAAYQLAELLKTIIINWTQTGFREYFVGLTAGLDTRTVLAAAVGAGVNFRTYTTLYPFIAPCDATKPPRIAARVSAPHFRHRKFHAAADPDARRAMMEAHMDGAIFSPAVEHFAKFEEEFLVDGGVTLAKGNCFEIGRCYFWNKFANLVAIPTDADQILAAYRPQWDPEPLQLWKRALQSWIASLSEPIPLNMDWKDRFYLEQRLGAWLASHQMYPDIFDSTNFYPANCLWISDLLLRPNPAQRQCGEAQYEVIRTFAPHLLDLPVNPERFRRRVRKQLYALIKRLKSLAKRQPRSLRPV
jgi:hypothetical protein